MSTEYEYQYEYKYENEYKYEWVWVWVWVCALDRVWMWNARGALHEHNSVINSKTLKHPAPDISKIVFCSHIILEEEFEFHFAVSDWQVYNRKLTSSKCQSDIYLSATK